MLVNKYQINADKRKSNADLRRFSRRANLRPSVCNLRESALNKICCFGLLFCIFIFASCICFAQEKITYEDKGRRDPFIALVTADGRLLNLEPVSKEVKIILEGIIYDKGGQSYAIINGEVVSAGGFIQGYTVFKIEKDKVILIKDDKLVEYKLEKEEP